MQNEKKVQSSLLVITKDYGNFQFLEQFLTDKGYYLLFAEDYTLAEKKIQDNYVDICIIDGESLGEKDFSFFRKIEEEYTDREPAFVYLDGDIPDDAYAKALDYTSLCFVKEPYNTDELLAKINVFIRMQAKSYQNRQITASYQASEARYQRFTDNVPGIAYTISSDGEILYWSPKLKEILGLEPMDLIENPSLWHDSIHPEDIDKVKDAYKQTFQGQPYTVEYRIRDIEGHWHWFHDSIFYKQESEGKIHFEAIAMDITDKIRAQELLNEKDDLYHSFFQRMGAAMLAVEPESGTIGEANIAAVNMYGYSAEDFEQKTIFDIQDAPAEQIRAELDDMKSLRNNRIFCNHKLANGEVKKVEVDASPLSLNKQLMLLLIIHEVE